MKVDGTISSNLHLAGAQAAELDAAGYSGGWAAETNHDPFLPLVLAAEHSQRLELGTGIAVAFARNPMTLANLAWDLQAFSGGRFVLGLGSQVKPHITKRFSMEWSHPAPRMRELILAIRAIWDTWQNGTPLAFRGTFYTHTLMTPFFSPNRTDLDGADTPRILLAGVGDLMTEVAGEVADGFISHPFTTEHYLRTVTLPALARGRAKVGKTMDGVEISLSPFVVTGATEEAMTASASATRQRIAFYGSTPAYRAVLDAHGWADLQTDLNLLSKRGEWAQMGDLIDDEMLHAFGVVGSPERIVTELGRRYEGIIQRLSFPAPLYDDPDQWAQVIAEMKTLSTLSSSKGLTY
ncbi:MAG: LLM class F420-dependent oxidoreductase [Acidimicrobiales bacterium]